MIEAGHGPPPCPYAVAVLGSAGRGESLLAIDQDNALVFARGRAGGAADRWFEKLGEPCRRHPERSRRALLPGGVMAKNAQWRGSVATWRDRIAGMDRRTTPQALLSVDIFFDLRGVHGERGLAQHSGSEAFDAAREQVAFAKLLAETAGRSRRGSASSAASRRRRAAST